MGCEPCSSAVCDTKCDWNETCGKMNLHENFMMKHYDWDKFWYYDFESEIKIWEVLG